MGALDGEEAARTSRSTNSDEGVSSDNTGAPETAVDAVAAKEMASVYHRASGTALVSMQDGIVDVCISFCDAQGSIVALRSSDVELDVSTTVVRWCVGGVRGEACLPCAVDVQ